MKYKYDYPRPMVTIDVMLLRYHRKNIEILLIERDRTPFAGSWAFPGGFIEMNETLNESAKRELTEETGLEKVTLIPLISAGNPGRDPRGRTITILHIGFLTPPFPPVTPGDDARKTEWFTLDQLPTLAFDHHQLVEKAFKELKFKLYWQLWILMFFSSDFQAGDFNRIGTIFWKEGKYTDRLIKAARHLKLIDIGRPDRWHRLTADQQILSLTSEKLMAAWNSAD